MPILETKSLVKRFDGVHAVDHLSLSFEAGKITGIIGPNGSGKSTLVNLLTGIIPLDSGKVVVLGKEKISKVISHEVSTLGITRTFQDVRLFEQMSVLDNVLVVLTERHVLNSLFERHGAYHLAKAEEVLKRVGLWEKHKELAGGLSYGQRKLLEIARILAMDSKIILLDEPFAGLFPEMLKIMVSIIKDLRACGTSIILIEHNMELIRELSDYVFVLDSGELLAEGKPEEVLARKDVIEAYLGE
ncbi:MAG: ABC transporter ATP-binding protein [Candidatus Pacebacteria bacterium]|nr:ABC transporter ATP-binding protein [Candidatus Paceibacterota bacterium]MDD5357232.1 ABC transporter ATP-binding protein [Candidatus Paceibacterota bacterium]